MSERTPALRVLDKAEAAFREQHPELAPQEPVTVAATAYRPHSTPPLTVAPRRSTLAHYGYGRKDTP